MAKSKKRTYNELMNYMSAVEVKYDHALNTIGQTLSDFIEYLEKKEERQAILQTNIDKAKNLYSKELEWMRRQPKARGTKSKARIEIKILEISLP